MICPANVNLSTIAAHNRGSVNVFVQEENGSLEAMAMAERSSRSVSTWNSLVAVSQLTPRQVLALAVVIKLFRCWRTVFPLRIVHGLVIEIISLRQEFVCSTGGFTHR